MAYISRIGIFLFASTLIIGASMEAVHASNSICASGVQRMILGPSNKEISAQTGMHANNVQQEVLRKTGPKLIYDFVPAAVVSLGSLAAVKLLPEHHHQLAYAWQFGTTYLMTRMAYSAVYPLSLRWFMTLIPSLMFAGVAAYSGGDPGLAIVGGLAANTISLGIGQAWERRTRFNLLNDSKLQVASVPKS